MAGGLDLNGDGLDDFAVTAQDATIDGLSVGAVAVFFGTGRLEMSDADALFYGWERFSFFGWGLDLMPDTNGDGSAELAIGAPDESGGGAAYVFLSPHTGTHRVDDAVLALVGEEERDFFGFGIASDDIDGDGLGDLLIGAPFSYRDGDEFSGVAYVVLGTSWY